MVWYQDLASCDWRCSAISYCAESGMIIWICGVSLKDHIPSTSLLLCLGLISINDMLCWNRLRFHGYLICMDDDAWPKKTTICYVGSRQPKIWSCKMLCDVICVDMKLSNLGNEDANKRAVWNRALKSKKLIQHAGILLAHVDSRC